MEIAAHDASGTYRAVYTVSIGESIYLPEEVQGRDRDTEAGDGTDPAAAQTVEK
jgi:phage-related protein